MRWVAAVALIGWLVTAHSAAAQTSVPEPSAAGSPLQTPHDRIALSLKRIAKGSSLWRTEIGALRGSGRRVFILTPDKVVVVDRQDSGGGRRPFDPSVLAEVSPVVDESAGVGTVLVVVNLELLDAIHDRRNSLPAERDADLDRIVVHEVYGHALPYLRAGNVSGRCADPEPGQRPIAACSIARENAVRVELGLGRRIDYGLNGLLLSSEADISFLRRGPALSLSR